MAIVPAIATAGVVLPAASAAYQAAQAAKQKHEADDVATNQQKKQDEQIQAAKDQQQQAENDRAKQAATALLQKQRNASGMTKATDMGGTILTSPLGLPGGGAPGGAKTLLGS